MSTDAATFFTHGVSWEAPFTDRDEPRAHFGRFMASLQESAGAARQMVGDPSMPRRNVLAYYGMGGIGKSALLAQLAASARDSGPSVSTVTVDFESSMWSTEHLVGAIRGALARHGRSWSAFDIVHAAYWAKTHPGQPLAGFLDRRSLASQGAEQLQLSEQVQGTLDDLLGAYGTIGLGWRAAKSTYSFIADRIRSRNLSSHCPFAEPCMRLIEENPSSDQTFALMASMLAWDLAALQEEAAGRGQAPPTLLVFLDGWENVQRQERRALENVVMHLVHVMPNVGFVLASRDPLDWAEPNRRQVLALSGPERWPSLRLDDQFRLDELAEPHSREYLTAQVPAPEIVEAILANPASGVPHYLYLSVLQFKAAGQELATAASFGQTLPEVLHEIMADRSPGERVLARRAAMLGRFDRDVLSAGAAGVTGVDVERFLLSPLVRRTPGERFEYSLERVVRDTVLECDVHYADRWSPREWAAAAEGMLEHLEQIALIEDRRLDSVFAVAVRVLAFARDPPDWVARVAELLAGAKRTQALLRAEVPAGRPALEPLVRGFHGLALRVSGSVAEARRLLEEAVTAPEVGDLSRAVFALYLGRMLLESGTPALARERLAGALFDGERHRFEARRLQAWCLAAEGDLVRAEQELVAMVDNTPDDAICRFELTVNRAMVRYYIGSFLEADRLLAEAKAIATQQASLTLTARVMTYRAQVRAWTAADAVADASAAIALCRDVGDNRDLALAWSAYAVAAAARRPAAEVQDALVRAHYHAAQTESPWRLLEPLLADVFVHAVTGDVNGASNIAIDLRQRASRSDAYRFWADIATSWVAPNDTAPSTTSCLDPAAIGRWQRVAEQRIVSVGSAPAPHPLN